MHDRIVDSSRFLFWFARVKLHWVKLHAPSNQRGQHTGLTAVKNEQNHVLKCATNTLQRKALWRRYRRPTDRNCYQSHYNVHVIFFRTGSKQGTLVVSHCRLAVIVPGYIIQDGTLVHPHSHKSPPHSIYVYTSTSAHSVPEVMILNLQNLSNIEYSPRVFCTSKSTASELAEAERKVS